MEARIDLDGEAERESYERVLIPPSMDEMGRTEHCPIYRDGDTISGQVIRRLFGALA